MDHVWQIGHIGPPEHEMLEAYTALGWLAAKTERVKLLTMVTAVVYREPGLLAKAMTTLDVLSGGPRDPRHRRGLERGRVRRPRPALPAGRRAVRAARGGDPHLQADVERRPGPVRRQALPPGPHAQLAAGAVPAAPADPDRRLGREEDAQAGRPLRRRLQHLRPTDIDEAARKLDVLREHCANEGRDYDEIEKTAQTRFDLGENGENVNQTIEQPARVAELGFSQAHGSLLASASPASSTCSPSRSSRPSKSSSQLPIHSQTSAPVPQKETRDHSSSTSNSRGGPPAAEAAAAGRGRVGVAGSRPGWCRCSSPATSSTGSRTPPRPRTSRCSCPPTARTSRTCPSSAPDGAVVAPDGPPPAVRTYTPRRLRPGHAGRWRSSSCCTATGPASEWAQRAKPGDKLAVAGPAAGSPSSRRRTHWWLAADESAIPAVGTLLEALPETATAEVHIEVDGPDDEIEFAGPAKTTITWHHRRAPTRSAPSSPRPPATPASPTAPGLGGLRGRRDARHPPLLHPRARHPGRPSWSPAATGAPASRTTPTTTTARTRRPGVWGCGVSVWVPHGQTMTKRVSYSSVPIQRRLEWLM